MRALVIALMFTLLGLLAAPAIHAQVGSGPIKIQIVGAEQVSPIAVSDLKNLAGDDDHKVSTVFVDTLRRDLTLSGYFRLIDPASYIENAQSSGYDVGQFNFGDWSSLNAEFLVKGAVTRSAGKVQVEALLFDVGQQRRMMGRKFNGVPNEVSEMARRFADAVMEAVTGQKGPFATKMAFVGIRGSRFKEIYTSWLDGGTPVRLTDNPTINLFPDISGDGRHILYLSYKTMTPMLYLADTQSRTEISLAPSLGMAVGGVLTADGRIVAAYSRGGATNLYLLDSQGSELKSLTATHGLNVDPAVCANGSLLAFASDRSGDPQIYTMDLAGGSVHRITYQGNYNTAPALSPDCKKIAYESRIGGSFQILEISAAGGSPKQLTSEGNNQGPAWSADGRYIAFSSRRGGSAQIYLMLAADGRITGDLTKGEGDDTSPSLSAWVGE
ncbi:MAG TPA: hypothetical protein VFB15_05575 [Candidatus Binataceae bacterium]|nr:hypothetical protein [Candidatus Binataceae bacterium]